MKSAGGGVERGIRLSSREQPLRAYCRPTALSVPNMVSVKVRSDGGYGFTL